MPFRRSVIEKYLNDDEFIKDVIDLINHFKEKYTTPIDMITALSNAYEEDEKGLIAVYIYALTLSSLLDISEEKTNKRGS